MRGRIDQITDGSVSGWAWDTRNPSARSLVKIRIDETLVCSAVADIQREDLKAASVGDGRHGFRLKIPDSIWDNQYHTLLLYVCDLDDKIAVLDQKSLLIPKTIGRIERFSGKTCIGWIAATKSVDNPLKFKAIYKNKLVYSGIATLSRKDLERKFPGQQSAGFEFPITSEVATSSDGKGIIEISDSAGRKIASKAIPRFFSSKDIINEAKKSEKDGKYVDANILLESILAEQPDNLDALWLMTRIAYSAKRYDDAMNCAKKVLSVASDHQKASMVLGRIYFMRKKYRIAIPFFSSIDQSDSSYREARLKLADCKLQVGQIAVSLQISRVLLDQNQDDESARSLIARGCDALGIGELDLNRKAVNVPTARTSSVIGDLTHVSSVTKLLVEQKRDDQYKSNGLTSYKYTGMLTLNKPLDLCEGIKLTPIKNEGEYSFSVRKSRYDRRRSSLNYGIKIDCFGTCVELKIDWDPYRANNQKTVIQSLGIELINCKHQEYDIQTWIQYRSNGQKATRKGYVYTKTLRPGGQIITIPVNSEGNDRSIPDVHVDRISLLFPEGGSFICMMPNAYQATSCILKQQDVID